MPFNTISVIGLGYIGLPTAAIIASRGVKVIGVDINKDAVDTINRGEIHIVEPDLDMVVKAAVATGNLRATQHPEEADAYVMAVPTPLRDNKEPDVSYVKKAVKSICPLLKKGDLVILESTSPVGTTESIAQWISEERSDLKIPQRPGDAADINIAHCPERVLPGQVLQELVANDRVIGGITEVCSQRAKELYEIFVKSDCIITDARTAEMAKLTENSFRDVNIAFANELSVICDEHKINVWELIALANRHPRVNILQPGPGVGGHCIAVDPWFIVHSSPKHARLIHTARLVNDDKPEFVRQRVLDAADQFKSPVIACLGLTFKPDIDDLRESPALDITAALAQSGSAKILAVEPNIEQLPSSLADAGVELVSLSEAIEQANTVVILVDHKPFKMMNKELLLSKAVVDTRGTL